MEEQKDKMEEWIARTVQRAGQEKDEQDLATLKSFMDKQRSTLHRNTMYSCALEDDEESSQTIDLPPTRTLWRSIISIAAVVALIFSLNIYLDNRARNNAFSAYYTPLVYDSELYSRGSETSSLEAARAMKAYESKDYNLALKEFNLIAKPENNILIYKAICLIETEQLTSAIELLQELVSHGEGTEYYQQANWYLALSYLREYDEDKAIRLLEKIIKNNGYYSNEAVDILKTIN